MKRSEIAEKFKNLGAMDSVEEIRAGLVELQNEFETDYEQHEQVQTRNDELVAENEKLTAYNKKLYLSIPAGKETVEEKQETKEYKFEDLFNEKGGLK